MSLVTVKKPEGKPLPLVEPLTPIPWLIEPRRLRWAEQRQALIQEVRVKARTMTEQVRGIVKKTLSYEELEEVYSQR